MCIRDRLNVKTFILDHLADAYEWQIYSDGNRHLTVSLPIILRGKESGWHLFSSSRLRDQASYLGFQIASEGKYKGKIVERDDSGQETRPLDLSLTKNAASLLFASALLILIVMGVARSLKRNPMEGKKGFVGLMEMFILSINDEIIKPSVGPEHRKYAPYLLTVFLFIFTNNLLCLLYTSRPKGTTLPLPALPYGRAVHRATGGDGRDRGYHQRVQDLSLIHI